MSSGGVAGLWGARRSSECTLMHLYGSGALWWSALQEGVVLVQQLWLPVTICCWSAAQPAALPTIGSMPAALCSMQHEPSGEPVALEQRMRGTTLQGSTLLQDAARAGTGAHTCRV